MTALGLFSLLAGALQLTIPSYALRLVRRFGTRPIGGFLVIAFSTLALLHLTNPLRASGPGGASSFSLHLIYVAASGLLLLGLCHLEALCTQRQRVEREAQDFRSRTESRAQEHAADLAKVNESLAREIAQLQGSLSKLAESERQYRFLFSENPQPMWISDLRTGQCLAVNKAALRQYGFKEQEFMGLTATDLLHPESAVAYQRELARPCAVAESRGVWQHRKKDRTLMPVEITATDLKFNNCPARVILARDVSEHRRRELELSETKKMQALGQVAAGVAHHFNNILTVIDGHADLMLQSPHASAAFGQLHQISSAARRGAALTRQLQAAAGRQPFHQQSLDLNGLIRSQVRTLQRLVGDRIVLQRTFAPSLPHILGDPQMIEGILANLVLNARDAMPAGGSLTIETTIAHFDGGQRHPDRESRAGDFVRLTVSDSGCGMPPEVQTRVFEPFFTTHDFGQATGLGLASVYGAVKQQGGWVEFSTKLGVGTEFRVFLPCMAANCDASQKSLPEAITKASGTILLVESDDRVRSLTRHILECVGYRVVEADDSAIVLALWQGQAQNIDLLLTNVTLSSGKSGRALASQLLQDQPKLKVLYTSDDEPTEGAPDSALSAGAEFLPKPYTPDKLLQTVQTCLSEKNVARAS